ncbi:MAG: hypothetical protein ACLRM8_04000 [Alistipes sp.]
MRYEAIDCDDADYVIVALPVGPSARPRSRWRAPKDSGRPAASITLYPFPKSRLLNCRAA